MPSPTVALIGACGSQARYALELLVRHRPDARIVAIDRDEPAAPLAGADETHAIDVMASPDALRTVLRDCDVAINCAGPFHALGTQVLDAACDTGCDYVDICDDSDATEVLLARDDAAREAGIRALIGLGASPGTTNIFARMALARLAALDEVPAHVQIAWCAPAAEMTPAIFDHLIYCLRTAIAGRPGVPDWSELDPQVIAFGAPLEPVEVVRIGHPEPLTLRRSLGVSCTVLGGITSAGAMRRAWELARDVEAGKPIADAWRDLSRHIAEGAASGRHSAMRIDAFAASGRAIRIASVTDISMAQSTALPAVAGALLLLRGNGLGAGCHPPESIDPEAFLKCAGPLSTGEGTLRAWDIAKRDGAAAEQGAAAREILFRSLL